jgi:hypothetical protein
LLFLLLLLVIPCSSFHPPSIHPPIPPSPHHPLNPTPLITHPQYHSQAFPQKRTRTAARKMFLHSHLTPKRIHKATRKEICTTRSIPLPLRKSVTRARTSSRLAVGWARREMAPTRVIGGGVEGG